MFSQQKGRVEKDADLFIQFNIAVDSFASYISATKDQIRATSQQQTVESKHNANRISILGKGRPIPKTLQSVVIGMERQTKKNENGGNFNLFSNRQ